MLARFPAACGTVLCVLAQALWLCAPAGIASARYLRQLCVLWKLCFVLVAVVFFAEKQHSFGKKMPGVASYNGRLLRAEALKTVRGLCSKVTGVVRKRHRISIVDAANGVDHEIVADIAAPPANANTNNYKTAILFVHSWRFAGGNLDEEIQTQLAGMLAGMGFVTCRFQMRGSLSSRGEADVEDCAAVARYLLSLDVDEAMASDTLDEFNRRIELKPSSERNKTKAKRARRVKTVVVVGVGYGGVIGGAAARICDKICGHVSLSTPFETLWAMSLFNSRLLFDSGKTAKPKTAKPKLIIAGGDDFLFTTSSFGQHVSEYPAPRTAAIVMGAGGAWTGHVASLCALILEWLPLSGCGYTGVKGRDGIIVDDKEFRNSSSLP